jgi:electron transport complex protein RnfC
MSSTATYAAHKTFQHGVHPPEAKDLTAGKAIRRLPFAETYLIQLSQHIGAPAKALVRAGQEVVRGEKIADPGGFVSVPMHAPVTGIVRKLGSSYNLQGQLVDTIFLSPHPASSQEVAMGRLVPQRLDSPEAIVQAVAQSGMVGLGGAAFPTHVKLRVPEGKKVEHLVINGVECEPFLTTDHRVMLEQKEAIFKGIRYLLTAIGAKSAILGIEANKGDAIEEMIQALPGDLPLDIVPLKVKYPQGAEKMLIKAVLNREVPPGKLPFDVGVVVSNVATAAELGQLLPYGLGMIERVVTITGPGVERPGNYMIPTGTPLRFVLDHAGLRPEATKVILGGPMMGQATATLDIPITKGVSGILVLDEPSEIGIHKPEYPCIRCGHCLEACPIFLNPSRMALLAKSKQYEEMADQLHLMDCFECGSCSFICPSNIPLVHLFRISKGIVRQRRAKK